MLCSAILQVGPRFANRWKPMSNSPLDTRRLFSYIFIGALALLFALEWGPGSRGCDRAGRATIVVDNVAQVNGKDIPLRDFARAYGRQLDALRQRGIPSEYATQFGMHTQVLNQLVDNELLAQAAESRGVSASDKDLREFLIKQPAFQKDGRFDRESYDEWVRQAEGSSPVDFELKLRRQLSAERMQQLVEASVVVSDDEVKARYLRDGNAANVSFVKFTPAMFADKVTGPKAADLATWSTSHEADIKDAYEKQKSSFTLPEQAKVRQILVKVPADASADQKAAAKARIEALRKDIVDNKKPFAEVATASSDDLETKVKGGDLGMVDRFRLPSDFASLVFALQPGEVTLPIETPIGFLIGTVEEKKAAEVKAFESVKNELASQLWVREKAKGLAAAAAEKGLADAKGTAKVPAKKLAELFPADAEKANQYAPETKPEVKETGEFNSTVESMPQLGLAPELKKEIFAMTVPGLVEHVVTIGNDAMLVQVEVRKLTSDVDFDAQKEKLRVEAIKGKQYETRDAFLKALKQSGTVVTNQKALDKVVGEG